MELFSKGITQSAATSLINLLRRKFCWAAPHLSKHRYALCRPCKLLCSATSEVSHRTSPNPIFKSKLG